MILDHVRYVVQRLDGSGITQISGGAKVGLQNSFIRMTKPLASTQPLVGKRSARFGRKNPARISPYHDDQMEKSTAQIGGGGGGGTSSGKEPK